MSKKSFSLTRLGFLLRGDFLAEWRAYAFICAGLAIFVFLISIQQHLDSSVHSTMYRTLFGYTLFIWGIWATSLTFRPLHDRVRRESWLLRPASTLEKLLARLLPLTIGIGITLPVYFFFLSVVIESFNLTFYATRRPLFDLLDPHIWRLYGAYIIVQSPFFLGAVWFRRFVFLKTTLILVLIHVALVLLAVITLHFIFSDFDWHFLDTWGIPLHQHAGSFDTLNFMLSYGGKGYPFLPLPPSAPETIAIIFYAWLILLPLILWWIAWLRLREVQVKNGV